MFEKLCEELKELLGRCQAAIKSAESEKGQYIAKKTEADTILAENKKTQKRLNEAEKELNQKNITADEVLNAREIIKNASADRAKIREEWSELERAKTGFDQVVKDHQAEVDRWNEKRAKQAADFDKEKKEYKSIILKEIGEKAGKK